MTEDQALEKNNRINLLFDFYESLLTEKQQNFTRYYFQDNYTLGEISALFHITRQAVYEHIKRAELVLEDYESKLHLLEKHQQRGQMIQEINEQVAAIQGAISTEAKLQLKALLEQIDILD
ncbi:MAG: YlxM family DNA-binding protein [Paenibacillaceae bacterium]